MVRRVGATRSGCAVLPPPVATLSTTGGYTASEAAYRGGMTRPHRSHHTGASVQSVTSVPQSLAEEQAARIKRYLFTMAIRTVCFIGAAFAGMAGASAWVWGTLAIAAIVLPYIAVVMANAVRPRAPGTSAPVTPPPDGPEQIGR
jgi:hypothetical protein